MQYFIFISLLLAVACGQYVLFERFTDAECNDLAGYEIHPQLCTRRDTNTSGFIHYATYTCSGDNVVKEYCEYVIFICIFILGTYFIILATMLVASTACKHFCPQAVLRREMVIPLASVLQINQIFPMQSQSLYLVPRLNVILDMVSR
jgi:hypothetical protein